MLSARSLTNSVSAILAAVLCAGGCSFIRGGCPKVDDQVPNEATRVPQPTYTIEPPDILLINAGNLVPRPPFRISPMDILAVRVGKDEQPLVPNQPISGLFAVSPEGRVDLGYNYGTVFVTGMTLEEARKAIDGHLGKTFKGYQVNVDLAQSNQALQQVRGEHLVRGDGTIGLGTYGSVYVDSMTVDEVKAAIEEHLSQFLQNPKISVDVAGFNSKVYYVITDLAGSGQRVFRLPLTGKETVLDGIAQVYGLNAVSSKCIWVARPTEERKLKVDWNGITQDGRTQTNYQLMAGDRIYVMGQPLTAVDTYLARVLSPIERLLGIVLLGSSAYTSVGGIIPGQVGVTTAP